MQQFRLGRRLSFLMRSTYATGSSCLLEGDVGRGRCVLDYLAQTTHRQLSRKTLVFASYSLVHWDELAGVFRSVLWSAVAGVKSVWLAEKVGHAWETVIWPPWLTTHRQLSRKTPVCASYGPVHLDELAGMVRSVCWYAVAGVKSVWLIEKVGYAWLTVIWLPRLPGFVRSIRTTQKACSLIMVGRGVALGPKIIHATILEFCWCITNLTRHIACDLDGTGFSCLLSTGLQLVVSEHHIEILVYLNCLFCRVSGVYRTRAIVAGIASWFWQCEPWHWATFH